MTENQDKVGERGKDTPASGNEDLIDSDGNAIVEQPDLPVQDDRRPPLVQISKAARLSAVFALAGPVCFIVFLSPLGWLFVFIPMLGSLLIMAVPILCAIAFILGVFGLASIAFSGGRRTGYAYAMVGISVPLMGVLILSLTVIPRFRALDHRTTCGTNLSGIGKAMLLYANDNDDAFPRAGGRRGVWAARTPSWTAGSRQDAYALGDPNAEDGRAGISSSLYLLIKYTEVSPKLFVCPGDKGTTTFDPKAYRVDSNMVDLWDFGPNPPEHCSYAYQMVYTASKLGASGHPAFAILADRSPWMDSPSVQVTWIVDGTPNEDSRTQSCRHAQSNASEFRVYAGPTVRQTFASSSSWRGRNGLIRNPPADPEGRYASGRREFVALEPPATGVLRTPSSERLARVLCWRPHSAKLPGQARFGHAFGLGK